MLKKVMPSLFGIAAIILFLVCLISIEVGGTSRPAEIRLVTGEKVVCSGGVGPLNIFAPASEEYLSCRNSQQRSEMPWTKKNKAISWDMIVEIRFVSNN